jgi:very-short-patch-repair endonuclease
MNDAWSSKNRLLPSSVFLQSNKKIIFNCLTCSHEYETSPNHYYNRNGSCPYCANKKLCQDINCNNCFGKSFASHPLVGCFSSKNNSNPRNIFKGSETKYIFECNVCHSEFESKMYNVLTGYWCPYCKNKTEAKILEFLKGNYSNYKTQLRFNWCRYSLTNNIMPFDFGIIDNKILIELDGEHHFNQVSNWSSPDIVQNKDIEKIINSIKNGYLLIHIYQKEVWNNVYDWKDILRKCITYLQENTEPQVLFISCCSKYSTHIQKLDNNIKYKIINPHNFKL